MAAGVLDMIHTISILGLMFLFLVAVYAAHGIYIGVFEIKAGIKGFNLKIETKEKKHPSAKD